MSRIGDAVGAEINANVRFPAASTFKVAVLVSAMRLADAGQLDLATKVDVTDQDLLLPASAGLTSSPSVRRYELLDLITMMIRFSDNAATDLVMRYVPETLVQRDLDDLGFKDTYVGWTTRKILEDLGYVDGAGLPLAPETDPSAAVRWALTGTSGSADVDQALAAGLDTGRSGYRTEPPNNYTTPEEMGRLLSGIWRNELASPQRCRQMLNIMAGTMTNSRIRPGLPSIQRLHNKTGTLRGVYNDVGIVPLPDDSALVIALLTRDSKDCVLTHYGLYAIANVSYRWGLQRAGLEYAPIP